MAFDNYDKCSLLLPMNGTNNGTTFTDWSSNQKTVTAAGNAKTSTAQFKYYDSSGLFDGSGDYLTVPNNSAFLFGTEDFFIGAYAYFNSLPASGSLMTVCGIWSSAGLNFSWLLVIGNTSGTYYLRLYYSTNGSNVLSVEESISLSTNTFYFLSCSRTYGTMRLSKDGSLLGTEKTVTSSFYNSTSSLTIAAAEGGTQHAANAHFQDLVVFKGTGMYTANFTPPARLIGTISGNVKDAGGNNASRIITACPRTNPTRTFSTTSDPSTGNYSLSVPATECSRIALADETTLYNDIVDRVIPE